MEEENKYLKRQRIYKTIMLVMLTIFLTFIMTTIYITNRYNLIDGDESLSSLIDSMSSESDLSKSIDYIKAILDKYYLYDIDEEKAVEAALDSYIGTLGDPYTEYVKKSEMEEYTEQIMGNYVGIGIYMVNNVEDNTIQVLAPIKDSPAEKAGVLPGDKIISVDSVKYTADEMSEAANRIKGEAGTSVELEIKRGEKILNFEIVRQEITTNPVISEKLENNIGYIQITSFDENTATQFKTEYEKLKNEGIKSLIIDLRNNGGGLVDETLEIANYFIPKGQKLLLTINKNEKQKVYKSEEDSFIDMPTVVLVNENSASASEILAGALQDTQKATIVGITTFGKGVIQQFLPLKDGSGLKVTVEEYYTPNGNRIHGIGIKPDKQVELPENVKSSLLLTREQDTQLQKAIELLK